MGRENIREHIERLLQHSRHVSVERPRLLPWVGNIVAVSG